MRKQQLRVLIFGILAHFLRIEGVPHKSFQSLGEFQKETDLAHSADAACQQSALRLAGGTSSRSGRLEICHDNEWGTVCDDYFGPEEAEVACKQILGESEVEASVMLDVAAGTGSILLDDVTCQGTETRIIDCDHRGVGSHNCAHHEDVGVTCSTAGSTCSNGEDVRLVGGNTDTEGRVEICHDNLWGTVCSDGFGEEEAKVVCKQILGFPDSVGTITAETVPGSSPIHLDEVSCSGSEDDLFQCEHSAVGTHNCDHSQDIGVKCVRACHDNDIRVARDSYNYKDGRLEMCRGNAWGSICDDYWNNNNADVACRQLGFSDTGASWFQAGAGSGDILLDDVNCSGDEAKLTECSHRGIGVHNCVHYEDVGATCQGTNCEDGDIQIVEGGRVEICYDQGWNTICYNNFFGTKEADVVCQQTGFFRGVETFGAGPGGRPVLFDNVTCNGYEGSLLDCDQPFPTAYDECERAGVTCRNDSICDLLHVASSQVKEPNRAAWRRRYEKGVAAMPEGEIKQFFSDKFLPDWDLLGERLSLYNSSTYQFIYLNYLYFFHPELEPLGCEPYVLNFAYFLGQVLELSTKEFVHPYEPNYSELHLLNAKRFLEYFSQNKGFNFRKEIDRLCLALDSSGDILFCRLAPAAKAFDLIEEFIEKPGDEMDFDILRVHLVLLPVWNPYNTLSEYTLQRSLTFEILKKVIERVVNAIRERDIELLSTLESRLPAFTSITGCMESTAEKCVFRALLGQVTSFLKRMPTVFEGVIHKHIYTEIDYGVFLTQRALLEVLRISQSGQITLLEVSDYLNQQIQCTSDRLASTTYQELRGYFTAMHTFEETKKVLDVAYVNDILNLHLKRSSKIANTVDEGLNNIIFAAVACATADSAYQVTKLVFTIAKSSNPLGWLTGGHDPNDILEGLETVSAAVSQVVRTTKLRTAIASVKDLVVKIKDGLLENSAFLNAVRELVNNIDQDDESFAKDQETFLELYGAYTPVITLPELTELGGYLELVASSACDIIDETEGPPAIVDAYKVYVSGGSGVCDTTAIAIGKLMEIYGEVYDLQFEFIEEMASVIRARTGLHAAQNLGSSWHSTVENCETLSSDRLLEQYTILAGVSYASYEMQTWKTIDEYCDVLEYQNGGDRPGACQGINTDIANLLAYTPSSCLGNQDFTQYYSIPTKRNAMSSYKDYVIINSPDQLNISALLAGENVQFQIPNSQWLIDHNIIQESERDYAIYVKQFEVYLPVSSSNPVSVRVSATSTASNHLVPGGTAYVIKPSQPLIAEYLEGHNFNCRGQSQPNPYNLCESTKLPDICLASGCFQHEFIPPSIYTRWNLVVNGYELKMNDFVEQGTDMQVQVSMTLCKKRRQSVAADQRDEAERREEKANVMALNKCCSGNNYWSSKSDRCTSCPSRTMSALHGYFCDDIDECGEGTDRCEQVCNNNVGSYTCSCYRGFRLDDNGYTCHDFNECSGEAFNDCSQTCINDEGSYHCECSTGLLQADGRTCQ